MAKRILLPTLLLVSDNPSLTFWIKKQLERQFFIFDAKNRSSALSALSAPIDFIIIDSGLEGDDPLELCKLLSQKTAGSLVPILWITGRLKKSLRDQALEAGVTDFLSDQLDAEELETRIAIGLKAAAARQKVEDFSPNFQFPKKPFKDTP